MGTDTRADLMFTKSFDWIMYVVDKIECMGYTFIIDGRSSYFYGRELKISNGYSGIGESKIQAVYLAVLKFIRWYNTQSL